MTSVLDLARLSGAIYDGSAPQGWTRAGFRSAWEGMLSDGLQAAVYARGQERVIAFRGTNVSLRLLSTVQDLGADLILGLGMNSAYFRAAQTFVRNNGGVTANLVLCGHSLGGAIAQIVGNRMSIPFATFNAPGVAVVASRNMGSANPLAFAVRAVGMVASAVVDPSQAAQDVVAAFNTARGFNVRADLDPVSNIGVHYGELGTCASVYRGYNPLQRHGIDNMITSLTAGDGNRFASRDSSSFA